MRAGYESGSRSIVIARSSSLGAAPFSPATLLLVTALVLAAVLRLWQLNQNGFGRQYYAAAVRSMMLDGYNIFFNSFDPAGFLSLDKPPVAMWLQFAGAYLLGFDARAVLLPQVVEGLTSILMVWWLVRRTFGPGAASLAALLLALTPASVAVDRSNNTESCLALVLLAATGLAMRAAETRRADLLCLAMAAVGIGFNVKMAAALVIVPTFGLVWLAAADDRSLLRRMLHLALAGLVLAAVSLSWAVAYDLTPAERRPYVGSTQHNSMLELALVHNGTARFRSLPPQPPSAGGEDRPVLYDNSPIGPLRLFRPLQAGQVAWWLPLVLAGILFGWRRRPDQAAYDPGRRRIAVALWGGWLATYWLVLSLAGGPVHTYYTAILAPPAAALAGIGLWHVWAGRREEAKLRYVLPLLLGITGLWQLYIFYGQGAAETGWLATVGWTALAVALAAAAVLAIVAPARRRIGAAAAGGGLSALLVLPIACALSVVLLRPNAAAPVASLAAWTAPEPDPARRRAIAAARDASREKLLAFLQRHRGNERFLVAVPNATVAAPLILATGEAVMAMGGYLGDDPILTAADLARYVAAGQLRYVMLGGFSLAPERQAARTEIPDWVRAHGRPVPEELWRARVTRSRGTTYRVSIGDGTMTMARPELYDLRPE